MNERILGMLRDLQQDSVFMSVRKMSQIIHEAERGRKGVILEQLEFILAGKKSR